MVQMLEYFLNTQIPDIKKAKMSEIVAEADMKVLQGGDEELNLLYSLSSIAKIIKGQ